MKIRLYFYLFLIAVGCQKDFYLQDLNAVNNQIEQLKSQINSKGIEGDQLASKKQTLQEQLADIQNKLNALEITLTQANEMIHKLETELIALEGVVDGIYEVVLTRNQQSLNFAENSTSPWWEPSAEESEFFEIKDSVIIRYTYNRFFKINEHENSDSYVSNRRVKDGNYYDDLEERDTTKINSSFKIQLSINRINLDTLEIVDYFKSSHKEDEEINIFKEKIFKKLVKRETFPKSKSEQELIDIFKASNLGFYSDPLYQTLDVSDPMDFIRVFIEDGKRHGVDLSHILNKEPYLFVTPIDDNRVCAWASNVCDKESIWIEYDTTCWDDGIPAPFYAYRLQVMYHELGHSILSYRHPMVEGWEEKGLEWPENVAQGYNGRKDDIMGYSFNHNWEHEENPQENWYNRLDRFFKGIDHEVYDCTNSKGNIIVID